MYRRLRFFWKEMKKMFLAKALSLILNRFFSLREYKIASSIYHSPLDVDRITFFFYIYFCGCFNDSPFN